jgi:hypothetical protein
VETGFVDKIYEGFDLSLSESMRGRPASAVNRAALYSHKNEHPRTDVCADKKISGQ